MKNPLQPPENPLPSRSLPLTQRRATPSLAKNSYLPKDDGGKADLLDQFAAKLPKYRTLMKISAADLASLQADAACATSR